MARILIAEDDRVFSALVADRLHLAGHEVEEAAGGRRLLEATAAGRCDLAIVELNQPGTDGVELVRRLRAGEATRTLPVLVVADHDDSTRRLEALRAGADDVLVRPCHLEEVVLRVDRLLGTPADAGMALHGDLAGGRLWDTLQYLERSRLSGTLLVRRASFSGRVQLHQGSIVGATYERLEGEEAMLALLGLRKGRFRFVVAAREAGARGERLALEPLLLTAAWLQDELARRAEHVPATGEPVRRTRRELPAAEPPLGELPIDSVLEGLPERRAITPYDLGKRLPMAPQKLRLILAWLVERGVVARPLVGTRSPSTTELDSRYLTELAVDDLLAAARQAGFSMSVVPFLVLAEPGAWSDLEGLVGRAGEARGPLARLRRRLGAGRGGTATFPAEGGRVALHLQELQAARIQRIEPIVAVCAGMVLWLDELADRDAVERLVSGLERSPQPSRGVLVTSRPAAAEWAAQIVERSPRWQASPEPPRSLLGLLRLLQPAEKR